MEDGQVWRYFFSLIAPCSRLTATPLPRKSILKKQRSCCYYLIVHSPLLIMYNASMVISTQINDSVIIF